MEVISEILTKYGSGLMLVVMLFMWHSLRREMGTRFDALEKRFGERFDGVEKRLDKLEDKVSSIDSRLSRLEEREGINREQGGYDRAAMGGA